MKKILFALVILICSLPAHAVIAHAAGCSKTGVLRTNSNSQTFTCTPTAANDAVVFKVTCADPGTVTAISMSGTSWTFTNISGVVGSASAGWGATFGAITPNTTAVTFTVTYTGATSCGSYKDYAMDEFSGTDTTGGATTFEAHNQATGSGSCSITVTPVSADDAIWGACEDSTTAVGAGYTTGQNDAGGDWTEYKILSGGAGASQTVNFSGSGNYVVYAVAIKPPGGAAPTTGFSKKDKLEKFWPQ